MPAIPPRLILSVVDMGIPCVVVLMPPLSSPMGTAMSTFVPGRHPTASDRERGQVSTRSIASRHHWEERWLVKAGKTVRWTATLARSLIVREESVDARFVPEQERFLISVEFNMFGSCSFGALAFVPGLRDLRGATTQHLPIVLEDACFRPAIQARGAVAPRPNCTGPMETVATEAKPREPFAPLSCCL